MTQTGIPSSRFAMWRAVVAMIHADGVVKPHEIHFVLEGTKDLPLSAVQKAILAADLQTPVDVRSVFDGITNPRDREDFFHLARSISWSDGDFAVREQAMIRELQNHCGLGDPSPEGEIWTDSSLKKFFRRLIGRKD